MQITIDNFTYDSNTITGKLYESYTLRLAVPYTAMDGFWRLSVYGWNDERGWFATINSKKVGSGYKTPAEGARAIVKALRQLGQALGQVKSTKIVSK